MPIFDGFEDETAKRSDHDLLQFTIRWRNLSRGPVGPVRSILVQFTGIICLISR